MNFDFVRAIQSKSGFRKAKSRSELVFLLERATDFVNQGNLFALEDLQRLVVRPLQSRHMVDAYLKADHNAIASLQEWNDIGLSWIPGLEQTLTDYASRHRYDQEELASARLGIDIVLPTCWHPASITNVLGWIGNRGKSNPWKQDSNHLLSYWYPMNIFWVHGGNHSIAQGILIAEGTIKATDGYDLSGLYDYVYFDGEHWKSSLDNQKIGMPRYKEFGYIFELGRLILSLRNQ